MWLLLFQNRGTAFLVSLPVGCIIGLIYDVFRLIRVVYTGGRIKLFFEDVLFCIMSSVVFTVFMFNVNMGVIRLFAVVGVLVGFFAYRFSIGLFTVPIARRLKAIFTAPMKRATLRFTRWVTLCHARCITNIDTKKTQRLAKKGFE